MASESPANEPTSGPQPPLVSDGPQLVIMAAGLGSRFGGVKQLAAVGSNGETILDFSIADAVAAGFSGVVLIVRSDIEADVRAHIERQHAGLVAAGAIRYVRQDDLGPTRTKPWGTLHAVLSAAEVIDRPFAVINADDYYGPGSYMVAADSLREIAPGFAANIVFEIGKTVPPVGAVSRGIVQVADGVLTEIVETHDCQRLEDGTHFAGGRVVADDTPVSMNFWSFHPSVVEDFAERWNVFLAANAQEPKAEAQLPTVIGELMADGRIAVNVLSSTEQWIGITNPDDLELVRSTLADR